MIQVTTFVKNMHKAEKAQHTISMRFDLLHEKVA